MKWGRGGKKAKEFRKNKVGERKERKREIKIRRKGKERR